MAALLPRAAAAQELRGSVVHPDSTTPAAGVLIELVGGDGVVQARTMSSSAGRFVVRAPAPGTYRVQALRIGYRPTLVEGVQLAAGGADSVHITLGSEMATLSVTRVSARNPCRLVAGAGENVVAVWEEARKALALAAVTAAQRRHKVTAVTYNREVDRASGLVVSEETTVAETEEPRAFRSMRADALLTEGFVVQQGGELAFFGPDADLLLSERFAATHCLRLTPVPGGDTSAIAIAFEPAERRDVIGIRGALTLSRTNMELQRLDFSYVGLPEEAQMAGGELEFQGVPGGGWLVRRWSLRMPVLDVEQDAPARRGRAPSPSRGASVRVRALMVTGGEVVAATQDGVEAWRTPLRTLDGRVVAAEGGGAVAGARVSLRGTSHQAVTDAAGAFVLHDVLPARYQVEVTTAVLDSLGGVSPGGIVDLGAGDVTGHVATLVSLETAYRERCRVARDDRRGALLRVTVRDVSSGAGVAGASVSLRWGGEMVDGRVLGRQQERVMTTEPDGTITYCGAPRGVTIRMRAMTERTASTERELVISVLRPFAHAELRLSAR